MLMNLNGRERSRSVFEDLLANCDPPLQIAQIHEPPKGELVLIEARLKNENEVVLEERGLIHQPL